MNLGKKIELNKEKFSLPLTYKLGAAYSNKMFDRNSTKKMDIFNSEHFYIQPNDIIYVYPINRKSWGLGTTGLQTFQTLLSVVTILTSLLLIKNL